MRKLRKMRGKTAIRPRRFLGQPPPARQARPGKRRRRFIHSYEGQAFARQRRSAYARSMDGERMARAVARIEAAARRIEAAAGRPAAHADPELAQKYEI